jgi:hypothetical protein
LNISFYGPRKGKKTTRRKTPKAAELQYIQVSPGDLRHMLDNWFAFLQKRAMLRSE